MSHLDYPPKEQGGINPSGWLRVQLDLFANIRPAKSRMGVGLTGKPVDLVIFRECTEGFYADRNMFMGRGEFMPTEDVAIAIRKVTAKQCRRIAEVAFEWARRRRKKVTAVHKANVLHMSDGLFLREVRAVAKNYPDVELDEKIVDAMAALLVRIPDQFDCIVTGNMFGDILSDEASELSGGLGIAGSTMTGDNACCAQAQHGSAPDIAGQDKANPVSLMLSAAMLLEWLAAKHQRPGVRCGGESHRSSHRRRIAIAGNPHRRSRRQAGHEGVYCQTRRGDLSRACTTPPDATPAALSVPRYCLPDR